MPVQRHFAIKIDFPRAILLASMLFSSACFVQVYAQSPNADTLRRIIDQKNAQAAAETWAGMTGYSLPSNSSSPSNSSGSSNANEASNSQSSRSTSGGYGATVGDPTRPTPHPSEGRPIGASSANGQVTETLMTPGSSTNALQSSAEVLESSEESTAAMQFTAAMSEPQPATITYSHGKIFIHADNSSLREILKQISTLTGMVIRGSLPDERVFGDQGPGSPSAVISSLLEGTRSNRLLCEDGHRRVTTLILTPRRGAGVGADETNSFSGNESQVGSTPR